jgi:hypothetical protein
MKISLVACPACVRHIRITEVRCPFCRAEVPASLQVPSALPPAARLSRAALYALRAGALSMTTVACGGNDFTVAPPYGGSFVSDAGPGDAEASPDAASVGDVTVVALYGAFFSPDASLHETGAGASGDAGPTDASDDHPFIAPPYGIPPPPPGK